MCQIILYYFQFFYTNSSGYIQHKYSQMFYTNSDGYIRHKYFQNFYTTSLGLYYIIFKYFINIYVLLITFKGNSRSTPPSNPRLHKRFPIRLVRWSIKYIH